MYFVEVPVCVQYICIPPIYPIMCAVQVLLALHSTQSPPNFKAHFVEKPVFAYWVLLVGHYMGYYAEVCTVCSLSYMILSYTLSITYT